MPTCQQMTCTGQVKEDFKNLDFPPRWPSQTRSPQSTVDRTCRSRWRPGKKRIFLVDKPQYKGQSPLLYIQSRALTVGQLTKLTVINQYISLGGQVTRSMNQPSRGCSWWWSYYIRAAWAPAHSPHTTSRTRPTNQFCRRPSRERPRCCAEMRIYSLRETWATNP